MKKVFVLAGSGIVAGNLHSHKVGSAEKNHLRHVQEVLDPTPLDLATREQLMRYYKRHKILLNIKEDQVQIDISHCPPPNGCWKVLISFYVHDQNGEWTKASNTKRACTAFIPRTEQFWSMEQFKLDANTKIFRGFLIDPPAQSPPAAFRNQLKREDLTKAEIVRLKRQVTNLQERTQLTLHNLFDVSLPAAQELKFLDEITDIDAKKQEINDQIYALENQAAANKRQPSSPPKEVLYAMKRKEELKLEQSQRVVELEKSVQDLAKAIDAAIFGEEDVSEENRQKIVAWQKEKVSKEAELLKQEQLLAAMKVGERPRPRGPARMTRLND